MQFYNTEKSLAGSLLATSPVTTVPCDWPLDEEQHGLQRHLDRAQIPVLAVLKIVNSVILVGYLR